MLKAILGNLGLIISLFLAMVAANWLAGEFEAVSHSRAKADPDNPTRHLELGLSGRAIMAAIPIGVQLIFYFLLSRFEIVSMIISIVLLVIIFGLYLFLRLKGFATFWSWFLIIWGNNICCFRNIPATLSIGRTIWSFLATTIVVAMIVINIVFWIKDGISGKRTAKKAKKAKRATKNKDEGIKKDKDDDDDDEDEDDEEEVSTGKRILGTILIIVGVIVIGGTLFGTYSVASNIISTLSL